MAVALPHWVAPSGPRHPHHSVPTHFLYHLLCYICNSIFSQHKYMTCKFSNELYSTAIKYSSKKNAIVSLYSAFIIHHIEKYPLLHSHTLFMPSLFGSTYVCKQLFSRMKTRKKFIINLWHSLGMATTSIKQDWCITFTKTGPHTPLVLWFCCSSFLCFNKKH